MTKDSLSTVAPAGDLLSLAGLLQAPSHAGLEMMQMLVPILDAVLAKQCRP